MYSGLSVERAMRDVTYNLPEAAELSMGIYAGWPRSYVHEEVVVCSLLFAMPAGGDVPPFACPDLVQRLHAHITTHSIIQAGSLLLNSVYNRDVRPRC